MSISLRTASPHGRGSVLPRVRHHDLPTLLASVCFAAGFACLAPEGAEAQAPASNVETPSEERASGTTPPNVDGATPTPSTGTEPPSATPNQVAEVDTLTPYVPPSTPTDVIVAPPSSLTTPPGPAGTSPIPPAPVAPAVSARQHAEISARPGQGVTISGGDNYSLTIRPRIQLRDTFVADDDLNIAPLHRRNEIAVRALRLWMIGHVLNPNIKYGIQLAFGAAEFEKNNPSPLYDAFFDFTRSRVASVKVGQYFVPFDRARTIREFALQTIDRTTVINELSLDRDVGASVYSNDLLGDGGKLGYQIGIFGGDGKNRIGGDRIGFLYTARFSYRPFGGFDEDQEGDLSRTPTPKLLFGIAGAYDQNSQRVRGTTGDNFIAMSPDYVWGNFDTVFKYRGLAFMGEVLFRYSDTFRHQYTTTTGTAYEYTQRALGYLLQGSYDFKRHAELWGRYEELHTPWANSQAYQTRIHEQGRTVSGGANYYLNGHAFKVQTQVSQTFGYGSNIRNGMTQLLFQLDATF